jgi:hypothetical protein
MSALMNVDIGGGKVRVSDTELHRAAIKDISVATHAAFTSLPSIVSQIIEHRTWKSYGHSDFASYVLDETSNGLGVNSNQRLWILRCAMDVHGAHIKEWADVLERVEKMVRLEADKSGQTIRSFNSQSLEELAKNVSHVGHDKITYLPSRHSHHDGHLIRLRKNKPDVFRQVVRGELSMIEARKAAGMNVTRNTNLGRAQSAFRMMTKKERREFVDWLKEEGVV